MMRWALAIGAMVAIGSGGAAQTVPADAPTRVDVALSSFKFTPATITLDHGKTYLLHFTNTSDGKHNFTAKRFFAAAKSAGGKLPANGSVALAGGQSADVEIVAPAPGRYEITCTHFMHSTFGMKGEIVVR